MNQRTLPLYHSAITEIQVYTAWLNNQAVSSASKWNEVVQSELLYGCLAREAAYTHRGQRPGNFSPIKPVEGLTMDKNLFVLDVAEARQIRLALALCRERIACPETTTVDREEAVRELRAAQDIFLAHEERAAMLQHLNNELHGGGHASA